MAGPIPGRYGNGRGGLGLSPLVKPASRGGFSKSWSQSVRLGGKPTSTGLGRYPVVTLATARERALENARAIAEGHDPRRRSACAATTFAEACETVIPIHAGNWKRGGRTEENWRATLRDYALPRLDEMSVAAGAHVMDVLLPIWFTKRDTARSVRQRIGAVMKWAVAHIASAASAGVQRARPEHHAQRLGPVLAKPTAWGLRFRRCARNARSSSRWRSSRASSGCSAAPRRPRESGQQRTSNAMVLAANWATLRHALGRLPMPRCRGRHSPPGRRTGPPLRRSVVYGETYGLYVDTMDKFYSHTIILYRGLSKRLRVL